MAQKHSGRPGGNPPRTRLQPHQPKPDARTPQAQESKAVDFVERFHLLVGIACDKHLAGSTKAVGAFLVDKLNEKTGTCFWGIDRIAKSLGLSRRSVQGAITALVAAGWFEVDRRRGCGRVNVYRARQRNVQDRSPLSSPKTRRIVRENAHEPAPKHTLEHTNEVIVGGTTQPVHNYDEVFISNLANHIVDLAGKHDDPRWSSIGGIVKAWLACGYDPQLDILPTVRAVMARRGQQGPPESPKYFEKAIARAHALRTAPHPNVMRFSDAASTRREEHFANMVRAASAVLSRGY